MRILLVDDDPMFLKIVSVLLKNNIGPVDAAFTGIEGLRQLRQVKFDLLITDLMMEGLNGIDLIRIALAERLVPSHGILVLTGEPARSAHVAWVRRRGIHVLLKPFSTAEFAESFSALQLAVDPNRASLVAA